MKKFVFTFAVTALLLTGCGQQNVLLDEEVGIGTRPVRTTENNNTDKPKRRETVPIDTAEAPGTEEATKIVTSAVAGSQVNSTVTASTAESPDDTAVTGEQEQVAGTQADNVTKTTAIGSPEKSTEVTAEKTTQVYYLDGIVYEIHDKYIIINETDFDDMQVTFADNSMVDGVNVGDTVEITYNGLINEGEIDSAYNAYSIEVTKKTEKCERQSFEYNGVGFSMLVPEGWSNRVIEYPQEGDFTDWGIRFTPDGESGSIDITWNSSTTITGSFDRQTVEVNGYPAKKYSLNSIWRFYVFDNKYVATDNFFESPQYSTYSDDMELMLNTIKFLQ